MSSEIETLAARCAALEATVTEHHALLLRLLNVPAVRMSFLGPDGFPAISLRIAPQEQKKGASDKATSIHPADQAIKDGAKLRSLAGELGRG
jgi:hypothetical protein